MATLELISYQPSSFRIDTLGNLASQASATHALEVLPQIYWSDYRGWNEVNAWALHKAADDGVVMETVKRLMKHLRYYADFLEEVRADWRHFPLRKQERVLRRFRKRLIDEIQNGGISGRTAQNCMNAVIQFYRFADLHNLVSSFSPMWVNRVAVIQIFDAAGFKRSIATLTTDLKIPGAAPVGRVLEDGLLPLRAEHMKELLVYSAANAIGELHLMLCFGFFTGARIGTIVTLTVGSLSSVLEDPMTPGIYLLRVGPGTGIATKGSVSGDLMVPKDVLIDLRTYANSTRRLLRQAKASSSHKQLLFLNRNGRPYSVSTVDRLVHKMRGRAMHAGLQYMKRFTFHQSRATFGTWLTQLLLNSGGTVSTAVKTVRDAMFHKSEQTTFGYVRFLETSQAKGRYAAEFNACFTGIPKPDWDAESV